MTILSCRDPISIARLVPIASEEGFNFIDRLIAEWSSGVNRFEREGETFLVIEVEEATVACGGLTRQRDGVGRLRRVFVDPDFRHRGIGRSLVETLIELARKSFDELVLYTDNPGAARFYEQLGFASEEPSSTSDNATHRLNLHLGSEG